MSVGDSRHYIIDSIMPRHFAQSAHQVGMPASVIQTLMNDLVERTPQAMASVAEKLPSDFPEQITASILGGMQRRLKIIEAAAAP